MQLCEGLATRAEDIGDLLFCDHTTKRWLVVEIAHSPSDVTPELQQRVHRLGQQVYGLLAYIGYDPAWVRTTVFYDKLARGLVDLNSTADGSSFTQVRRHVGWELSSCVKMLLLYTHWLTCCWQLVGH